MIKDQRVVVKLEDIYGMIILLAVGLSGSVVIMIVELLSKALSPKIKTIYPALGKCYIPNQICRYMMRIL